MVSPAAILTEPVTPVTDAAFGPGVNRLATGTVDGKIFVYSGRILELETVLDAGARVVKVLWIQRGKKLTALTDLASTPALATWRSTDWTGLGTNHVTGTERPLDAATRPSTEQVVVSTGDPATDGKLTAIDTSGHPETWVETGETDLPVPARDIDFNLDGSLLSTVHEATGTVQVLNTRNPDPATWTPEQEITGLTDPYTATFSGGSIYLAATDTADATTVFNTKTWTPAATIPLKTPGPAAFSPTGDQLAVSQRAPPFQTGFWSTTTWRQIGLTSNGHTGPVNTSTWSPNGSLLATASQDTDVTLWKKPVPKRAKVPTSAILEQGPLVTEIRTPGKDPTDLKTGEPVQIVYVTGNPLNKPRNVVLIATVDDTTIGTQELQLQPGQTTETTFTWIPENVETDEICGTVNGTKTCKTVNVTVSPSNVQKFLKEHGLEIALPEEIEKFFLDPLRKTVEGI